MKLFALSLYLFFIALVLPAYALPLARERVAECQAYYKEIREPFKVEDAANGPVVHLPALPSKRRFEDMTELRVMTRNMLNLETRDGAYQVALRNDLPPKEARNLMAKPQWARDWLAQEVGQNRPDVLFVQEVHGFHSLRDFAEQDLRGRYRPLLVQGNDGRIDIGILVRKDLPLDVEVFSQANRLAPVRARGIPAEVLYHRDTPLVLLRRAGASEAEQPLVGLLGVHLKSQRDSLNDPGGFLQRSLEARGLFETQRQLENRFPKVPMLVLGDYNSDLQRAPEFTEIRKSWVNTLDLAAQPVPLQDRVTHFYYRRHVPPQYEGLPYEKVPWDVVTYTPEPTQLDGSYLTRPNGTPALVRDSRIIPYLDERGGLIPNPQTQQERNNLPSDHRGLITVLDFLSLRRMQGERLPTVAAPAPH